MEKRQSELFKEKKVFFAFSDKQVKEGMAKINASDRKKLTSLGSGMICPKTNAEQVIQGLDDIYRDCIKQDIKENGIDKIILRELCNHEAFYVGDINETIDILKDYPGITARDIKIVYLENFKKYTE